MKNLSKTTIRLIAVMQIFAITLLASCTTAAGATVDINQLSVCHITGDSANPYQAITFTSNSELENYRAQNPDDISPVPVNGCPETLAVVNDGNIMICHVLVGEAAPYSEIAVSVDGLDGHGVHAGDIIPAPQEGCPVSSAVDDKITICHATSSDKNPYNEITISKSGLNGHTGHAGDIIPAPAGGCPTTKP